MPPSTMGWLDIGGDDDEGGIIPRKPSKLGVVDVVTELGLWMAWAITVFVPDEMRW